MINIYILYCDVMAMLTRLALIFFFLFNNIDVLYRPDSVRRADWTNFRSFDCKILNYESKMIIVRKSLL